MRGAAAWVRLEVSKARRLRELESENTQLKKLLAETVGPQARNCGHAFSSSRPSVVAPVTAAFIRSCVGKAFA